MKRFYFPLLFVLLLIVFTVGRLIFSWYNSDIETLGLTQFSWACLRGLPLDIRTAAALLLVPALLSLQKRFSLRALLAPYYIFVGFLIALIVGADTIMYEFWKFKLGAVVISYAMSPEGATSSVEPIFLITRAGSVLAAWAIISTLFIAITPKRTDSNWKQCLAILVLALLPLGINTAHVRKSSLFANHTATNSIYAFASSFLDERTYHIMPTAEATAVFDSLYAHNTGADIQDTLLTNKRPNLLFIQLESFSGKFVKELGGIDNVAPQMSQLIPQGLFFTNYYSNSFRTDRGTVALQSGMVSHPTLSLMREFGLHGKLASLPNALRQVGYETAYVYGGPMTNMHKREYLQDMLVDTLYDYTAFTPEQLTSAWGAHDEAAAYRTVQLIKERKQSERPWAFTFQTISSHEPWVVPYKRLSDPKLNAFAYTDDVLGQMIATLKNDPELWDNLLVIILPDHGYLYEQTYEEPAFFHSPMLWLGGALKHTGTVDKLMNQSDIAATLLAQMGISAEAFPWSRNIFSRAYKHPFVYCNFPAGLMMKDATGTTLFDLTAREVITEQGTPSAERLHAARALLQRSYEVMR